MFCNFWKKYRENTIFKTQQEIEQYHYRVNKGNKRSNILDTGRDPWTETGQSRLNSRIKYSEKLSNQQHRLGPGPFWTGTISAIFRPWPFGPGPLWTRAIICVPLITGCLYLKWAISDPKISKGGSFQALRGQLRLPQPYEAWLHTFFVISRF